MPDPIAVDALPADSSPAADQLPLSAPESLDTMSDAELHDWRMTGADPRTKVPASPADPPPAEPVEQAASTDALAVEAPSEGADPDPAIKPKTQARIDQVLADRAKERERAERAEARLRELETRSAPDARPAVPSTAPTPALVEPDPETYPYGTADPGYVKAVAKYEAAAFVEAERAASRAEQTSAQQREAEGRMWAAFKAKTDQARERHPDFDAVAMTPTEIPQGSAADLWILEDPSGAEILYHLQQPAHATERRRILALPAREQLSELVRLGDRLTATAPAARSTSAPPPPPTLSTRATPADPVARALAIPGDEGTGAYIREQNRRELARLKR